MLREMSWRKFCWWRAFDQIEPIGGKRGDWQAASICASALNAALILKGSKHRFDPEDLLLEFKDRATRPVKKVQREGKTWQEMKFIAQVMAAGSNVGKKRSR